MKKRSGEVPSQTGFLTMAAVLLLILPGFLAEAAGRREEAKDIPGVRVSQPWAREIRTPGGNGAVYMKIGNSNGGEDALLSARMAGAEAVELHTHIMDGAVARMRRVSRIPLPPGKIIELKPGGFHIMLIGVENPLTAGETIEITLEFEKAGSLVLTAPVRPASHGGGH